MPANLSGGSFKIVSLIEGTPPTSVNPTLPAFQNVRLSEPIQTWILKRTDNSFRLSIGGYPYTGIVDGKVTASINPEDDVEWHITWRENQHAYTIEPVADQSKGWSVSGVDSGNPAIEIQTLISTKSLPPLYLPFQLFQFQPVE